MENLDEQILEKLQMGWSWAEIAEMYHVGNNRISRIAKENGIVKKKSHQKTIKETLQTLDNRVVPCAFTSDELNRVHDASVALQHRGIFSFGERKRLGMFLLEMILKMNEAVNR